MVWQKNLKTDRTGRNSTVHEIVSSHQTRKKHKKRDNILVQSIAAAQLIIYDSGAWTGTDR